MKELTIQDVETIVHRDENRVMEAKETTGELVKGMQSGCAFRFLLYLCHVIDDFACLDLQY